MLLVRWLVLLLLVAGVVSLGLSQLTGQKRYRRLGILLIKWTVMAGVIFFGVLIVQRVIEMV